MADLTLPLLGLTTLIGYFFNKDGRASRQQPVVRTEMTVVDQPNGQNVYSSDVVAEANAVTLQKSLDNYKAAENPAETGYIPPLFNTYSVVGKTGQAIVSLNSEDLAKTNDLNRRKNVLGQSDKKDVSTKPMFTTLSKFENIDVTDTVGKVSEPLDTTVNILTGLPYDTEHNNMVPFFGSSAKQNMESFANTSLLDKHTGNKSTFAHKKELGSLFDRSQENIYGAPVFTESVDLDRYIPSLYKQGQPVVDPKRINAPIAGTVDNTIRPVFKDVNELRPGNRPKETYEARTIAGQMGEVRGVQPPVEKRRPETFYKRDQDHLFRGPGAYVEKRMDQDFSTNLKASSRQDYNLEYYGNAGAQQFNKTSQRITVDNSKELASALFQQPRRQNFENDYLRNVSDSRHQTDQDDFGRSGITQYESERSTTGDQTHLLNVNRQEAGVRVRPQDNTKTTLKQTTLHSYSGHVKTGIDNDTNELYNRGIVTVDAKATQKESLVENKYLGQSQRSDGMGYLVSKREAPTTNKEIISANSSYIQTPGAINSNPRVYKSEVQIRDHKQDVLMGERPRGPQTFQTTIGKGSLGETKLTDNMLFREHEDTRESMNVHVPQVIPTKSLLGTNLRYRKDNGPEDTIDRMDTTFITEQLAQNPFVIDTSKRI